MLQALTGFSLVCALPTISPVGILNLAVVEGGQLVVSSGDSLKLTCVASLDPDTPEDAVSLTWTGPQGSSFTVNQSMKEGTNLTRVLSVAVVGPEDGGTYTCSVSVVSGGGSMNRAAIVDITVLSELSMRTVVKVK